MVRMGDWKLIMNSYGKGELYNLKKDPYEINNLFGNPKLIDKQSELLTKLLAWELRLHIQAVERGNEVPFEKELKSHILLFAAKEQTQTALADQIQPAGNLTRLQQYGFRR